MRRLLLKKRKWFSLKVVSEIFQSIGIDTREVSTCELCTCFRKSKERMLPSSFVKLSVKLVIID